MARRSLKLAEIGQKVNLCVVFFAIYVFMVFHILDKLKRKSLLSRGNFM